MNIKNMYTSTYIFQLRVGLLQLLAGINRTALCLVLILSFSIGHITAADTESASHELSNTSESSAILPVSDGLPEDGSGIALLEETQNALGIAVKKAKSRFEKENSVKLTSENSDSLNPEKEFRPVLIKAFKKSKGTGTELFMLFWILSKHVFPNEETYPAILQAWKNYPNRWEVILAYGDELLLEESNRSSSADRPVDKRAMLLWLISEKRKMVAHMEAIKPEVWKDSKTLAWWFKKKKIEDKGRPGAPLKIEDVLPSYAWAVKNCIYDELELVSAKLCLANEAKDILSQIRTRGEDALKKQPAYIDAGSIRNLLNEKLPRVEKELAEHPELWPVSLPKWDGRPSLEIKLEND